MHTHAGVPAEDCPFYLKDLSCGCQDVYWSCGLTDFEHDHVACDRKRWNEQMEKLISGETFTCYCGMIYESETLRQLCHAFHQAPEGGARW